MDAEPVIFSMLVEGLFLRGLKGRLSEERRERVKKLGVDLNRVAAAYPRSLFNPLVKIAAEEMADGPPTDEHFRNIGQRLVMGVVETKLGFALLGIARLVGPRRTLLRLDRNIRAGDNYTTAVVQEIAPSNFRVVVNDIVGLPTFYMGQLEAMVELCGGKNIVCTAETLQPPGATFSIAWN